MRKFWDRKNDGDERRVGGRRRSFSGAHKGRGLNVPPSPHLTPTLKNSGSAYGACAVSLFCFFVRGNERTFHFTLLGAEVCCISLRVHDLVSLQLPLQVFRVSLFCFFRCFFLFSHLRVYHFLFAFCRVTHDRWDRGGGRALAHAHTQKG